MATILYFELLLFVVVQVIICQIPQTQDFFRDNCVAGDSRSNMWVPKPSLPDDVHRRFPSNPRTKTSFHKYLADRLLRRVQHHQPHRLWLEPHRARPPLASPSQPLPVFPAQYQGGQMGTTNNFVEICNWHIIIIIIIREALNTRGCPKSDWTSFEGFPFVTRALRGVKQYSRTFCSEPPTYRWGGVALGA